MSTSMGVAQGSSVSNILFSLLLNDLPESIDAGEAFMYADDVAVVVCAKNHDSLERKLNEAAAQVCTWFKSNGLVLNLKKTHFINFHLTRPLSVYAAGTKIEQVEATPFLGFQLDQCMTWESHIDKICGKLSGACYVLRRVARVVPAQTARSCYFAVVHSVLQYGAELWGFAAEWKRAFRAQKQAVRSIERVSWDVLA
ncbi:hypothetical protein O0L34_g6315 [Tuta absoluta]|nr:hypothetical protein O0L34_g6315 [Tuta absoluta]